MIASLPSTLAAALLLAAVAGTAASQNATWADLQRIVPRQGGQNPKLATPANPAEAAKRVQALEDLLARSGGAAVEPFVQLHLACAYFHAGDLDRALATAEDLKSRFPTHGLCTLSATAEGRSLVDDAIDDVEKEIAWRRKHPESKLVEPVLAPSPTAIIRTTEGDIHLRFYMNVAPDHVKNFVKLAKEGFYDGTAVHQFVQDSFVQLGDPNTRDDDRTNDGRGGPGYKLDQELSILQHARGVVTQWKNPGEKKDNGSQFVICVREQPQFDFQNTAFAMVVKGIELVEGITRGQKDTSGMPVQRTVIRSIEIIE